MFKGNSKVASQAAVLHAQKEMERVAAFFDKQEFIATQANVTIVMLGTHRVKSVASTDGDNVAPSDVFVALERATEELSEQRDLKLLAIRNQTLKKFKFDIKGMVPDVAAAVAKATARQNTAMA
jgi:DNA-binding protein YbaB